MLVYRQEPHTVHTGRGVDCYKPVSPKCFQNESWLTVMISHNTRCKSSGIYKRLSQMKCSMITGLLVWVSHCTFIEFWVVGSSLAEWVQMDEFSITDYVFWWHSKWVLGVERSLTQYTLHECLFIQLTFEHEMHQKSWLILLSLTQYIHDQC